MWDWVYDLINSAVLPLRLLVGDIAARISSVWSAITNTIARWRSKADLWVSNLTSLMPATLRNGLALYLTLRYLLFVFVPRTVAQAVGEALTWTLGQLVELRAFLIGKVTELADWAWGKLQELAAFATRIVEWAAGQLAELRDDVRRIIDHVFGVLGSPERLVAWILGPLIWALVAWALDNVDRLAYEAFRRRRFLEDQALTVVERVVDRFV